jgi:DMSO/TMAO reductase YedYZ molybdopterin-dependent catalytic subunit
MVVLGLSRFLSKPVAWARAEYSVVKTFLIRSIEGTQKANLKTWRLKIEGLLDQPLSLSLAEIKGLPQKVQTKTFICVEGWGLENQRWTGVHLKEIFSKIRISPKAEFVSFHATGGQYFDSLSIQEALEPDTMLAYQLNGKDLPPENGFPLRLVVPRMYGYKGVKWVEKIVFTETQEIGYWEHRGYSPDGSVRGL